MTYSLNNNYNNASYQQSMGLGPNAPLNIDADKIRESAKNNNNIVSNTVKDRTGKEKAVVALTTAASWAALCLIMAKFNKSCRTVLKEGTPTSLLHKVQSGADKLGHIIEDNKFGKKVFSSLDTAKSWTKTHIIDKNKILSAIVDTPAKPQLSSPKMMLNGTLAETAQDAIEAIEKFYMRTKGVESEEAIEKLSGLTKKMRSEQGSKETVSKLLEILQKLEKQNGDKPIEVGPNGLFGKVLERKVYPSELINKLNCLNGQSIIGDTKDLSRLGKIAPKGFLRVVEGLTNGTAGGRLAIAMQAMCFGDAIVRTAKAPKGEKKSTFAESIINDLSFYLMMPLGLAAIYGAGGTKYIGMNKAQVANYRKELANLAEKVQADKITKAEYKTAVKNLKEMLKGDTKILKSDKFAVKMKKGITNIVNKPVKALGKFFTAGLEQIPMYRGKDANVLIKANLLFRKGLTKVIDLATHIPLFGGFFETLKGKTTTLKGFGGGAMRFATYMLLISPFLAKTMTKLGHKIFGKPTNSILDEDKAANEIKNDKEALDVTKKVVNTQRAYQEQHEQYYPAVQVKTEHNEPYVRQNLLDKYKNQNTESIVVPEKETVKEVPEKETLKEEIIVAAPAVKMAAKSTGYIPSSKPVVLDRTQELRKFNKAMSNSYIHEKRALYEVNQKRRTR